MRKFNSFFLIFNALIFFLSPRGCLSAPVVDGVSGLLTEGGSLSIVGKNFGEKLNPAPRYYSDFEGEVIGEIPSGWLQSSAGVAVSNNRAWSGAKALEAAFAGGDDWSQIRRDLGALNSLFFSANIYFEKNDTCGGQWKGWRATSSPDAYNIRAELTTTSFINDYWFFKDPARWGNNSSFVRYDGGSIIGATVGVQTDFILFDQWQRIDQFIKGSSAPSVADGYMWTRRIGRDGDLQSASNFISYDADDKKMRYFMIGQAWGQLSGCDASTSNAKVYYDNVYIDDTQARVEIGDSPIWSSSTHREIQIPTSWDDGVIEVTVKPGAMSTLLDKYLFVVDANGNVSNGFSLANVMPRPMPPRDPKMD